MWIRGHSCINADAFSFCKQGAKLSTSAPVCVPECFHGYLWQKGAGVLQRHLITSIRFYGSSYLTVVGVSFLEVGVYQFILQAAHLLIQGKLLSYFELCQIALQDYLLRKKRVLNMMLLTSFLLVILFYPITSTFFRRKINVLLFHNFIPFLKSDS